jgi:methionine salvage enolase-phosphatase E1
VNHAVNHAVAETKIQAVLTDIEGTTSSLSFVHEVLFPYARERMAGFVRPMRDRPRYVGRSGIQADAPLR